MQDNNVRVFAAVLLLMPLLFMPVSGTAQTLPPGNGRDAVLLVCTQCHSLNRLTKIKLTAAQWENALYDMIARGAPVQRDDLDTIKKYLIDNFAVDGK